MKLFPRNGAKQPEIRLDDLAKAQSYRLEEGDILFARTGASVGKSFI